MIKVPSPLENIIIITIIYTYAHNYIVTKYIKQKVTELKGELDNSIDVY